jgi:hypothetical protein
MQDVPARTTGQGEAFLKEDFRAPWAKTLALPRGSKVSLIQVQPDWCYVAADDGTRGFVPTTKLEGHDGSV